MLASPVSSCVQRQVRVLLRGMVQHVRPFVLVAFRHGLLAVVGVCVIWLRSSIGSHASLPFPSPVSSAIECMSTFFRVLASSVLCERLHRRIVPPTHSLGRS